MQSSEEFERRYVPGGHAKQRVNAEFEYFPELQSRQVLLDLYSEYFPSSQGLHKEELEAPQTSEYFPSVQDVQ
jgi:hypothetical protein